MSIHSLMGGLSILAHAHDIFYPSIHIHRVLHQFLPAICFPFPSKDRRDQPSIVQGGCRLRDRVTRPVAHSGSLWDAALDYCQSLDRVYEAQAQWFLYKVLSSADT